MRRYLFDLLRAPGEENQFMIGGRPDSRVHNLPRMPLLCGDNPITNTLAVEVFPAHRLSVLPAAPVGARAFLQREAGRMGRPRSVASVCGLGEPHGARSRPGSDQQHSGWIVLPRRRDRMGHAQPLDLARAVPNQSRSRFLQLWPDAGAGKHRPGAGQQLRLLRGRSI